MDDKYTKEIKNDDEVKSLPEVDGKNVDYNTKEQDGAKYDVSHAPTPHVVHVKKSPAKKLIVGLLILALISSSCYLGYAYLQEKDNANNLQQQLNSVQSQSNSQQGSSDAQQPETSEVSYSAEFGKFTLSLTNEYVIIKNIDGVFEGGPVTDIEVAKTSDRSGVINGSYSPNKVMSNLKQGDSLDTQIQFMNQEYSDVLELDSIKVDGVDAKVYRLSGLFDVNRVYFEKGDNFYELESLAPSMLNELSADMQAIIAGFKFIQ